MEKTPWTAARKNTGGKDRRRYQAQRRNAGGLCRRCFCAEHIGSLREKVRH
jgi:hypothetical protein